jgi:hypothetical protein
MRAAKSQSVDRADIDALFALQSRLLIHGLASLGDSVDAASAGGDAW